MSAGPRARHAWLDRLVRAYRRYDAARGDFYAAAITYFSVFALFPLLMVGFAVAGFVLAGRPDLLSALDTRVKSAVSGEFAEQVLSLMDAAIASRTSVGVIGLATALWAGLSWMSNLREALSQMWGVAEQSAGWLSRKGSDLLALVSAFVAILATLGLTALADPAVPALPTLLRPLSLLASVLVAWLMFTWMIARLPRTPVDMRSAARAGLLAAVAFEVVKQLGSLYLRLVMHGPAGVTFGPLLGLMVFAYVTARLILFAAAWAAERYPGSSSAAV